MPHRSAQIIIAAVVIIASIVALIFTRSLPIQITASTMIAVSTFNIAFKFFPERLRKRILTIEFYTLIVLCFVFMTAAAITATNLIWQLSIIIYLVLSVAAFLLRQIRNRQYSPINWVEIFVWYLSTICVFFASRELFDYEHPVLTNSFSIQDSVMVLLLAIYFAAYIYHSNLVSRVGYVVTIMTLLLCASILYGFLPISIWEQYVALLVTSVVALPFLAYVCIRNYPNLEGTVDVILIMCILKAISYFAMLPEINTQITPQLFNF